MIIWEMCVFVYKTRPGVRREARFCISVSNFHCYDKKKKAHPLLEIWLVPKCSGQCLQLMLFIPQVFIDVLCVNEPSPHLRLEKCSLGYLAIKASINYRKDETVVYWKPESAWFFILKGKKAISIER